MSPQDIKMEIDSNNEKLLELIDPTKFTLNKKVNELLERNRYLQSICLHNFNEEGVCDICGAIKEE